MYPFYDNHLVCMKSNNLFPLFPGSSLICHSWLHSWRDDSLIHQAMVAFDGLHLPNLKLVWFGQVLPSTSLGFASSPRACDCANTLFRSSALRYSVKLRIRCDRALGLTQSSPLDSKLYSPRRPLSRFPLLFSPPSADPPPHSTPCLHLTEGYNLSDCAAHVTRSVCARTQTSDTDTIWEKRQKRQIRWMTLSSPPPKNSDSVSM